MRKLLIILAFFTLSLSGQTGLGTFNGGAWTFQGGIVGFDTWSILMADSYLSVNDHYSESYASEVREFLISELRKDYYTNTFGDSTTADWLHVFNTVGNISTQDITKSGNTLRWEIEDIVYNQNDLPNHTLLGSDEFLLLTSTDAWDGLTVFSLQLNNFTDYLPSLDMPNLVGIRLNDNGFTNMPKYVFDNMTSFFARGNDLIETFDVESSNMVNIQGYTNNFDSIATPEKWISTALNIAYMHDNYLKQPSVDNLYDKLAVYFGGNEPIKNLSVWTQGINNAPPTCGSNNPDILRLSQIYDSAGYAESILIASGGTGELDVQLFMSMPDTVYILTGEEFEIYDEGITGINIKDKNINIEYSCSIGWESFFGYKFSEIEADTGYYDFKAIGKVCADKVDSVECVVRLIKGGNGSGTKTFNMIGNSLTVGGETAYVGELRENLTGITAEMHGTQGNGLNLHEGNSGYRVYDYISDFRLNLPTPGRQPMWIDGYYNYHKYRTDSLSLVNPVDFTIIQLGINDVIGGDTAFVTDYLIDYFEEFVDSMILDNTGNIIIAMPPKSENTGDGWQNNYPGSTGQNAYLHAMQYLWDTLCSRFSGSRYDNRVYVSPQGVFIDRDNGYPKDSEGYHTNGVHPNGDGYNQLSNALRALVEGILKEE